MEKKKDCRLIYTHTKYVKCMVEENSKTLNDSQFFKVPIHTVFIPISKYIIKQHKLVDFKYSLNYTDCVLIV